MVRRSFAGAAARKPYEIDGGIASIEALTAAPASSRPAPIHWVSISAGAPDWYPRPSFIVTAGRAVFIRAALICAGLHSGCRCFTSAAAPATIGAAKLVP